MNKILKGILFWGLLLLGVYFIGKPYRESGEDIGVGFVISFIGLGTILYFVAKALYAKEIDAGKKEIR